MNDGLKFMKDNVWDLVELPKSKKPIGYKWVFKTKWDLKGNVERYKARFVAKGFTQREDIDYKETFPMVSIKDSFRIIMTLVAHFDLELQQMDINTGFLMVTIRKKFISEIRQFWSQRFVIFGLQIKKIHLWSKASIQSMVFEIWSSNIRFYF